ncbi:hypothetical protein MC885_019474 [Smutsia gigantea]|nr:hypothetical protein MC885_019474 [Smutsia gigantea]
MGGWSPRRDLACVFPTQISTVWNGTLVKLLRSLYVLALPTASRTLRSAEQEVRWRLRRLKYKQLAFLVESSATHMQEQGSQELLAELLVHLERRWAEIEDGRTVVAMMVKAGHLSESLMNRLEDKCLELVEHFGPDELRKVLVTLAALDRRSVPVLRAVSYHLVQKPFLLTKSILLDLAYAYGKLGFHQTQVFQRLAADLLPHTPSLTSSEVARCTKSFAFLKWLNLPLFEAFTQHVLSRAQSITAPHLCNMLLAFARVNFRPEGQDQFFSLVWSSCPAPSLPASAGRSRDHLSVGVWVEAKFVQRSLRTVRPCRADSILCVAHACSWVSVVWRTALQLLSWGHSGWDRRRATGPAYEPLLPSHPKYPTLDQERLSSGCPTNPGPQCGQALRLPLSFLLPCLRFPQVHEKLGPELEGLDLTLQVDVVWALCVLQQVRDEELHAVLCPEFQAQFLGSGSPKDQSTFQKLVHISATAQLEHPEYTGPLLSASALVPLLPALDRKVTPLQKDLQGALRGLLGTADRGSFTVATQYGWVLGEGQCYPCPFHRKGSPLSLTVLTCLSRPSPDAEVLLDADGQFLPLRDFVAPHLVLPCGSQPLPTGAKRLAFLRWEFPNFNSRSKDLLGRFALARRHLLAAGFLLVDVPYYEWLELKSEWQKGAYLKDKMRKAVAEQLAK